MRLQQISFYFSSLCQGTRCAPPAAEPCWFRLTAVRAAYRREPTPYHLSSDDGKCSYGDPLPNPGTKRAWSQIPSPTFASPARTRFSSAPGMDQHLELEQQQAYVFRVFPPSEAQSDNCGAVASGVHRAVSAPMLYARSWYAGVAHSHSQLQLHPQSRRARYCPVVAYLESPLPRVSSPRALCQSRSLVP